MAGIERAGVGLDALVSHIRSLSQGRQQALVDAINKRIQRTGSKPAELDDILMTAVARRLYLYALRLYRPQRKSGPPSPQYKALRGDLEALRSHFPEAQVDVLPEKIIETFCRLQVNTRGSSTRGFYFLAALFAWQKEDLGEFNPEDARPLIPASELKLGQEIALFIARRINEEAVAHREARPFPHVRPIRPRSDLPYVTLSFLQEPQRVEQLRAIFHEYQTREDRLAVPADDNAHFILYRGRRSQPAELIKSYLVIRPPFVSERDEREHYHPCFHLYRAPTSVGGTQRPTPGRAVPLDAGLFIFGGQRKEPLRGGPPPSPEAGTPFRALEVLFFPWPTFDASRLFSGLALTVINGGDPIVARICARPTVLQRSEEARIGSISVAELERDLLEDRAAEERLIPEEAGLEEDNFLSVYKEFGDSAGLSRRIADTCNNNSVGAWDVAPGFVSTRDNAPFTQADVIHLLQEAFRGVAVRNDEPFVPQAHLRIAPLAVRR